MSAELEIHQSRLLIIVLDQSRTKHFEHGAEGVNLRNWMPNFDLCMCINVAANGFPYLWIFLMQ
jgi:hypothetical protein